MLRSILYDILNQDETFFYHFQPEHRKYQAYLREQKLAHNSRVHYESLQKILQSITGHETKKRLYLVIDAVDESSTEDRRDIIKLLFELCRDASYTVKIFIASRPVGALNFLSEKEATLSRIKLEAENKSDIERIVGIFLKDTDFDGEMSHKISEYILKHADGVFVWVRLVLSQLKNCCEDGWSVAQVFRLLYSLPTGLHDMYVRILRNLKDKVAKDMFEWVLFTCRPLTVSELQHALAMQDSTSITEYCFEHNKVNSFDRKIVSCGGNLLECKGQKGTFPYSVWLWSSVEPLSRVHCSGNAPNGSRILVTG
jgi:hypothetical protein